MSNFKIGYARVSTNTQDEALQLDALQQAQVDRVFIDRASGSVQDRPGLTSALECARAGDSSVAWRLDCRSQSSSRPGRRSDLEEGRDALVGLTDASCCLLPLRCAALRRRRHGHSGLGPGPGRHR